MPRDVAWQTRWPVVCEVFARSLAEDGVGVALICKVTLQVITAAEFHPSHCSTFAFSSSKGCIRLADMRAAALCDSHAKAFEATEPQVGHCHVC